MPFLYPNDGDISMKKSLLTLLVLGTTFSLAACDNGKAKVEADLKAAQAQLVEVQKQADEKVSLAEKQAQEKIAAAQKTADEKIAEAQKQADAKIAEIQKNAESKIAEAEAKVTEMKNSVEGRIAEATKVYEDKWNSVKESLGTSMTEAKAAIAEKIDSFGKVVQGVATDLKTDSKNGAKSVEEVKADTDNKASETIENIKQAVTEKVESVKEAITETKGSEKAPETK